MKIKRMMISNFKGIKSLEVIFKDGETTIVGANGTGKSSVNDAFNWVLFDKDSQGQSPGNKFLIKPVTPDGETIFGLNTTVKIDFEGVSLKKVYSEKWNKKGTPKAKFTGNLTTHFIDDVQCKLKKEYTEKVEELVGNIDKFKICSDIKYFNSLKWQTKRKYLEELVNGFEVEISEEVKAILGDKTLEYKKEYLRQFINEKNKIRDSKETRVDEAITKRKNVEGLEHALVVADIERIEGVIYEYQKNIAEIENGVKAVEIDKKINELKSGLIKLKNSVPANTEKMELSKQLNEVYNDIVRTKSEKKVAFANLESLDSELKKLVKRNNLSEIETYEIDDMLTELRAKWKTINSLEYDSSNSVCPVCKQDLPDNQVQLAKAEANTQKAEELEKINKKGAELNATRKKIGVLMTDQTKIIDTKEKDLKKLKTEFEKINHDDLDKKATEIEAKINSFVEVKAEKTVEYKDILKQIKAEQVKKTAIKKHADEMVKDIEVKITEQKSILESSRLDLSKFKDNKEVEERLKEIDKEHLKICKECEELERQKHILNEFSKDKASFVENKVNKLFKIVKFNLIHVPIDGDDKQICEMTIDGVIENSLNTANRTNGGLDIIRTFQKFFNVEAPIFIDNRESVTEIEKMETQIVNLFVDDNCKKMEVI